MTDDQETYRQLGELRMALRSLLGSAREAMTKKSMEDVRWCLGRSVDEAADLLEEHEQNTGRER